MTSLLENEANPARGTPCLRIQNVGKAYGQGVVRHEALRGISFTVGTGEFVALEGPSGCGKSTLLHILGAMDRPTSGEVWLGERRLDTMSVEQLAMVRRREIGFVFQAFNLLPTLSTLENVSLPLRLDGVPARAARDRAMEGLEAVGLEPRAGHEPSQLSGGEQQRAAIARALVLRPKLILADEPTGSLDSVNGLRVLELLANLNRTRNITVIMATHSQDAAQFATRRLFVRDGKLDSAGEVNAPGEGLTRHGVL
jgi:putative ABC transport system ATP-binding protein